MYVIGIDPAASSTGDWFAFAVSEVREQEDGGLIRRSLDGSLIHRVIFAERYHGLPLFEVPALVRKRLAQLWARDNEKGRRDQDTCVVYDATGFGRGLYEVFQQDPPDADYILALTLSPGQNLGTNDVGIVVPKRDLVFKTMAVAGQGRLTIPRELKLWREIEKEFRNLQTKVRAGGGEAIEGAGSKSDDLAMAVCYATWAGERTAGPRFCGSVAVNYA